MPPHVSVHASNSERSLAYVPFLGTHVKASIVPALLARRAGAVLVPVTVRRQSDGRYGFRFLDPIEVAKTKDGPIAAVAAVYQDLEDVVLEVPAEWEGWMAFEELLGESDA
jgi:lauroyl/myristoyl acyltransferase